MSKKTVITRAEIEKDIIAALKQPEHVSEKSYKKWTIPCILLAIALVVIEWIYPIFILWVLLALVIFLIVGSIVSRLRFKQKIKQVSLEDYEITVETVHSISEEHYKAERGGSRRRRTETVNNYILRFENDKEWWIPRENYAWNERLRTSALGIYRSAHRGDEFLVVTEKDTGKIVMAYHTECFEYKR